MLCSMQGAQAAFPAAMGELTHEGSKLSTKVTQEGHKMLHTVLREARTSKRLRRKEATVELQD